MRSTYFTNKDLLSKLVEMAQADKGLQRVAMDWTRPEDLTTIGLVASVFVTIGSNLGPSVPRTDWQAMIKDERYKFIYETPGISISGSSLGLA
jgi:hypothetical protein